jgi:hypothetical protein
MAPSPGPASAGSSRHFPTEDLRRGLTRRRIVSAVLTAAVLVWAVLHPPTRIETYPPGTLYWNGVDEIA